MRAVGQRKIMVILAGALALTVPMGAIAQSGTNRAL